MVSKDEEKEFIDVVHPQKQDSGYTVRISSKSNFARKIKSSLSAVPILYHEEWCDLHKGWHISLYSVGSNPPKCHENEILKEKKTG